MGDTLNQTNISILAPLIELSLFMESSNVDRQIVVLKANSKIKSETFSNTCQASSRVMVSIV